MVYCCVELGLKSFCCRKTHKKQKNWFLVQKITYKIRREKIDLLEKEANDQNREIGYIFHAQNQFGK